MNRDNLHEYWIPACENLFKNTNTSGKHHLDSALGTNEYEKYLQRRDSQDYEMCEELKHLLAMLAGPHGHTVLKIYRLRKGLES